MDCVRLGGVGQAIAEPVGPVTCDIIRRGTISALRKPDVDYRHRAVSSLMCHVCDVPICLRHSGSVAHRDVAQYTQPEPACIEASRLEGDVIPMVRGSPRVG